VDPLVRVLAPTTADEFFANHFERAPLHVSRNDPEYFAAVYGTADVEAALVVGAREPEQFALVRAGGEPVTLADVTLERPGVRWRATGKASRTFLDPHKVAAYLEQGYTLIIKDAALFSASLQRFSNRLQHGLRSYAQTNVYLTPARAQGFEVHHDTHDTLTLQLAGEKTWRVYAPLIELPLESQPFHSGTKVPNLRLLQTVRLCPGDTLYLPRGFPHEASSDESTSLHATFALMPARVIDVLEIAIKLAADADVELRRTFPPSWTDAPEFAESFVELVAGRLRSALTPERVRMAREVVLNEQFAITRADAAGSIEQVARLRELSPDTVLRLDDGVAFMVREREKTVDLLVAGKSLGFPKFCKAAFERLVAGPTTVAELDSELSDNNRSVLIRTLVLEGLVHIEAQSVPTVLSTRRSR
jgi:hypothetical protein